MSKKQLSNLLWIEKYRPQSVKDMILPKRFKQYFTKFINVGEIKNLILSSSSPGTGKTTLAKALCEDMKSDYMYINASVDTGVDIVRNNIQKFATVKSFNKNAPMPFTYLDELYSESNVKKYFQMVLRVFFCRYDKLPYLPIIFNTNE